MQSQETQITKVKWTNAGGQTKPANERSFVYRPPAWRRWRNVKTTLWFPAQQAQSAISYVKFAKNGWLTSSISIKIIFGFLSSSAAAPKRRKSAKAQIFKPTNAIFFGSAYFVHSLTWIPRDRRCLVWVGAGRGPAGRGSAGRGPAGRGSAGLGGDEVGQRYIFQIKMAVCVAVIGKEVFRFILGDYENLFFSIEDMLILL